MKESIANQDFKKDIKRVINRRQSCWTEVLNPKDIRRIIKKAIKEVCEENFAQQKDGE